jgi:hypothetical protein
MWIATNIGFFSMVQDRNNDEMMYIRGRDRNHFVELLKYLEDGYEIIEDLEADYRYRIHVSRNDTNYILDRLVDDIDYDNFKKSVKDQYLSYAYVHIWKIIHDVFVK